MSTAPNGYQTPKTNWASADVPTPSDFNRIEGNVQAIESGSRTIDPTQAPASNVGTLRQLLDWFANRIKAITGKANWYDAPDLTLAQTADKFDASAGHKHSGAAGDAPLVPWANISSKPSTFPPSSHTHPGGDITSPVANADYAANAGYATSAGSAGSASDADKLDGYDANTGTAANTIPVRDANGKVPGSITGDAHTVDGYHASSFAIAPIPVTSLKKAQGSFSSASGGASSYFSAHQYAFASPSLYISASTANYNYVYQLTANKTGGTTARLWYLYKSDIYCQMTVTWDYLTASGHPRVWAIVDDAGNILSMWEAEDPVDEEFPDECPIGLTDERGNSIIPVGGAVVPVQFPTEQQLVALKGILAKTPMPQFASRGVWVGHKTPEGIVKTIFDKEMQSRGLEPIPDVREALYVQDIDKRNWRIQLWLRAVSRVRQDHRAFTLIPLFEEMFRVDERTGQLTFK